MILTTTNTIEGHKIQDYLGIVTGVSVNSKKASFSFKIEKYYESFETSVNEVKEDAFQKLKENAKKLSANAIIGISVDLESSGTTGVLFVSITGTAVKVA